MVLKFKFTYKSSDKILAKFLDFAAKQFTNDYKIYQELNTVYLYISADEKTLEDFSNSLDSIVAMSIFYYGVEVDIAKDLPQHKSIDLSLCEKIISLSPSLIKDVEDENSKNYYNAFTKDTICKNYKDGFFILNGKEVASNKELFENLAKKIDENKKLKIKTLSGTFVFSKVQNIETCKNLLVANIKNINSLIVENATSIVALASIEKPKIEFKINEIYKSKNKTSKEYINLRVANDLTLHLLCLELAKLGIDFVNIDENYDNFDDFLDISSDETIILDIPKIVCFDNKKLILQSNSYPKKLDTIYNKFNLKDKSQFMTVLAENELFENAIINFFMSFSQDDKISYYSKNGLVDILEDLYIPKTVSEIFDEIKKTKNGDRLIENYLKKFEDDYQKAISTSINFEKKSFFTYFQLAKIVLNFKNDIFTNAINSLNEKGPRIDYKIKNSDKALNKEFDFVPLFKSALSFKLAGVDEELISLGFVESFAHFIANEVDNLYNTYDLDGVSLCGDVFANSKFNYLVEKSITKNFKIYYNKEFVIQK